MKALRFLTAASSLLAVTVFCSVGSAEAQASRLLTGELVATRGTQFRLVGHDGQFTAPAGTPLATLDGRNVQVELASSGQVMRITEAPVPVNPVSHGWSTIRGELMVTDPATRRFTFAGDSQTYVAPPSIDIAAYGGKQVEIKLDETGQVSDVHLISSPPQSAYGVPPVAGPCTYRGQTYSAGAAVCQSGTQYRCDGSHWQSLGSACQVADTADVQVPPMPPRSCSIGDATVAHASSICRNGVTFRCDDGAWINVQTPCR